MTDIRCPLRQSSEISLHEPGLVTGEGSLTYHEFDQLVMATVLRLRDAGFQSGDRVALLLPSDWRHVTLLLALMRIGATVCPLSPRLPEAAVAACLQTVRVEGLVVAASGAVAPAGVRAWPVEELVVLGAPATPASGEVSMSLDQPATILLTSGSNGIPKAVLHTYGNHYYNALGSNANLHLGSKDRWLLSLPLYHVSGLAIVFRCLLGGAAVVIPDADETLEEAVVRHQVTHVSMVSTQLQQYLAAGCPGGANLKAVLVGGGPVPAELLVRAEATRLPVLVSYGLTEMASQVTTTVPYTAVRNRGVSGSLLRYRELKLAEDGEILVRGRTRFAGYVEGDVLHQPFDGEGWFATRDFGRMDDHGNLTLLGRKDNMFVSGGENVQPEEIEALLRALDGIEEAIVVPVPDATFGQRPVAFVRTASETDDVDQLKDLLSKALPRYKVPDAIYPWPGDLGQGMTKYNRPRFEERALRLRG